MALAGMNGVGTLRQKHENYGCRPKSLDEYVHWVTGHKRDGLFKHYTTNYEEITCPLCKERYERSIKRITNIKAPGGHFDEQKLIEIMDNL